MPLPDAVGLDGLPPYMPYSPSPFPPGRGWGDGLVGAGKVLTGPMLPYAAMKTALERVMTSEEHQFQSRFPEDTADVHRRTNSLPAWIAEKGHNTL